MRLLYYLAAALGLLAAGFWLFSPKHSSPEISIELAASTAPNQSAQGHQPFPDKDAASLHRATPPRSLRIQSPNQQPIRAHVWIVEQTEALVQKLKKQQSCFKDLWEDSLVVQGFSEQGAFYYSLDSSIENSLFAIIEAEGFAPGLTLIDRSAQEQVITLLEIDPIQVMVIGPDSMPLENARCWLRPANPPSPLDEASWEHAFALSCYGAMQLTNEEGIATFSSCYPGQNNTIQVLPLTGLAGTTLTFLQPGDRVLAECEQGFSVRGHVFDKKNHLPVPGASVIFSIEHSWDSETVLSSKSQEDGTYRAESLPARASVLSITAIADGYADNTIRLFRPDPHIVVEKDFYLAPAKTLELKLRTTWGDPIANSSVQLRRGRYAWMSNPFKTDNYGTVRFPPILMEDSAYELLILVENQFWAQPDLVVAPGQQTITVPGLSRILSLDLDSNSSPNFKPETASWTALSSENQGYSQWSFLHPSPLLPSGPGFLTLMGQSGEVFELSTVLDEGVIEYLTIEPKQAFLHFQWEGPGNAKFTISSRSGTHPYEEEEILPGEIHLPLWPGIFSFSLQHENGERQWLGLDLRNGSLDLGSIGGSDSGKVFGTVTDIHGNQLDDIILRLLSCDQAVSFSQSSDSLGEFAFSNLPPGDYFLLASGGNAYGNRVAECQQEIMVRPGMPVGPISIQLQTQTSLLLHGKISPPPPFGTSAFLTSQSQTWHADVLPDNQFFLPQPKAKGFVGVVALHQGLIYLVNQEILPGSNEVNLSSQESSHRLRLVDESGESLKEVIVYVYVNHAQLPGFAIPNGEGELFFQARKDEYVSVQFRFPSGFVKVYSLDEILETDQLVIPSDPLWHTIFVEDKNKSPLSLASALRFGVGDVYQADGLGKIHIPQTDEEHPFLIEAPLHLGLWAIPENNETISLTPLVPGLTLTISQELIPAKSGSPSLLLQVLHLPENSVFPNYLKFRFDHSSIDLPPLPPGQIELTLLDEHEIPLASKSFEIHPNTSSLIWNPTN